MLGPIAWRTPPAHYGPWELVTSLLTEGLVAAGIDVTLFATGDSITAATLCAVSPHGYAEDPTIDGRVAEALHVANALSHSGEFDVIHNQLDWLALAFSQHSRAPMLTTIHGFSGAAILPAYRAAKSHFVAISEADRSPELTYLATIGHGIDFGMLQFQPQPGDDLVVFGRIHPDKGTAEAIAIAAASHRRLIICGIIQDERYFADLVAPHVDGDRVQYLGSVGPQQRSEILGSAAVLLHPISFAEPFGLSVIEAMACGTPVIAYRKGSMPEVIDEGVTGFVVEDAAGAVAAIGPALSLPRAAVRLRAQQRFSVDRMVQDYLRAYEKVLAAQ